MASDFGIESDCAYIENQRVDQPYYICSIKEFHMTKQCLQVTVQWYYRSSEVPHSVYHTLRQDRDADNGGTDGLHRVLNELSVKQRELFSSNTKDMFPASALRGKCDVEQMPDVNSLRDMVSKPDTFFYIYGYNPETRRLANTQGEIRIGPSHQVALPELRPISSIDSYDDNTYETKVWAPPDEEEDIDSYLEAAKSLVTGYAGLAQGKTEDSDYLISDCVVQYNALMKKRFVKGLRLYGKNFHRIRKELFSEKDTGDLIEFYYHWKKTKGATNAKAYRKHRRNIRRQRAPRATKIRNNKSELPDLGSASEDGLTGEEGDRDRRLYCCRHCYSTTSRSWHHSGVDKQLLCDDCRIYFKKYGEMKSIPDSVEPPAQLLKLYEREKEKEKEKRKKDEMEVKRRRPRKVDNGNNRHSSRFTRNRSSPSNSDSSSVDNGVHRQDVTGSNAIACSPSSSNGSLVEQKPKRRGRVPTKTTSTKRAANKSIDNRRRKRSKKKVQSQKSVSSDSDTDDNSSTSSTNTTEEPINGNAQRTNRNSSKDQESIHVSTSARFVKRLHHMKGTIGSARTDLSFTPLKQMEIKGTSATSTPTTSTTTTSAIAVKQDKKSRPEMEKSDEKRVPVSEGSTPTKSAFKPQDVSADREESNTVRNAIQERNLPSVHNVAANRFTQYGNVNPTNNYYMHGHNMAANTLPSLPNIHNGNGLLQFQNPLMASNECHSGMLHGNPLQHQHHHVDPSSLAMHPIHQYGMPALHSQLGPTGIHPIENNFMSPLLNGSYIPPEVLSNLAMGNIPSNAFSMNPELQRMMQFYSQEGLRQTLSRNMIDQVAYEWTRSGNAAAAAASAAASGQPPVPAWFTAPPMLFNDHHQGVFPPGGF
ncbi:uncharacterized protein TRIADDRAFT_57654 [Trichoplax adhaerens]|uniref:Arginine-glutamic acid dipeptide repeats protein n=1 Tax=Trichoplax adhaerens TaxID=10228 RepID=B3S020_TRIAD|nr:hypothetical protein TRIADDRAFT_57654 [Trichoplax adhaerens]EDV24312.1 hypothetical protein TRIADDRAFT_57654 [Trichoplax adhaerens]|eukprot:XP_002113838.1 hypothetical protein TRIADDRAFT_57654 [Trichoplax adhaerens]